MDVSVIFKHFFPKRLFCGSLFSVNTSWREGQRFASVFLETLNWNILSFISNVSELQNALIRFLYMPEIAQKYAISLPSCFSPQARGCCTCMCMAIWSNEMNKLNINMVQMDTEFPLGSTHIMAFYSHMLYRLFQRPHTASVWIWYCF